MQRIAERYRRARYDVWIEPPGSSMPPRLSWLQGDLIAQRGNEQVLVLIEGDDEQLQLLADVIEHTAGWRLEIDRFDELGDAACTGPAEPDRSPLDHLEIAAAPTSTTRTGVPDRVATTTRVTPPFAAPNTGDAGVAHTKDFRWSGQTAMTKRQQQLERIARRYQSEGFEVTVDPGPELTPERLAWLRADLVAQRGHEHILVLLEGTDELDFLSTIVNEIAGWRLDLHRLRD